MSATGPARPGQGQSSSHQLRNSRNLTSKSTKPRRPPHQTNFLFRTNFLIQSDSCFRERPLHHRHRLWRRRRRHHRRRWIRFCLRRRYFRCHEVQVQNRIKLRGKNNHDSRWSDNTHLFQVLKLGTSCKKHWQLTENTHLLQKGKYHCMATSCLTGLGLAVLLY